MNFSQLRIKLAVAAGIIASSLLAATLTGCSSADTQQSQANGPYGPYGRGPSGPNGMAGPNGQQPAAYGMPQQMGSGDPNSWTTQNRQAFMAETQRIGAQPNLSAEDVIAMSRSGVPDQQIAIAIQQRGTSLRSTPGMAQYLAQNHVNPAVLGTGSSTSPGMMSAGMTNPSMMNPGIANAGMTNPAMPGAGGYPAQVSMNTPATTWQTAGRPASNPYESNAASPASYPPAQSEPAQAQSAIFEQSQNADAAWGNSGGVTNAASPAQTWRPMPR
jgi:hypothetical protein